MGYTNNLLDDVRAQLAPEDTVLKEARERRDIVCAAAESFRGATRSFASGSLAHKTANCPIHQRDKGLDADCGVVLSRVFFPELGPDGTAKEGPDDILAAVLAHTRPRVLRRWPRATFTITKRAIYIEFHAPLPGGEDPTVDLVVGLTRASGEGLWIPNTEQHRWDPSHPEKHTDLLTAEPQQLRLTRAHAIRLAKAENKRSGEPVLCSFNIEAFGLMFVAPGMSQATVLGAMWRRGAADLREQLTPDPAGVSAPIKVADRDRAIERLDAAADALESALAQDGDPVAVRRYLRPLFPEFIAETAGEATKARAVEALKSHQWPRVASTGVLTTGVGASLKQPRSFGELWFSEHPVHDLRLMRQARREAGR